MKTLVGRTLAGALVLLALPGTALAADHAEAAIAAADPAADLADFFAWYKPATNTLVVAVTFAPLTGATADGGVPTYDADVLYGVHIDNDGDNIEDESIWIRFGQNTAGEWGVQVSGIPGEDAFSGAVESAITSDAGTQLWAGLTDDPFFFDFEGFEQTLASGTLSFDATRDSFAGLNVTSIVLEIDATSLLGSDGTLQTWATTGRN
jgi:hypothetical protein